MFIVPPQFRNSRTPGQVPSAEGMKAVKDASEPAPEAKFTAKRILDHNEPRFTPRSVVNGLGLDSAVEQSWMKFLGDMLKGSINEVGARKSLYEKFKSDRMDQSLRNVLFQRSMSYYRTQMARNGMQKSGIVEALEGKTCTVVSLDDLHKAMKAKLNAERLEDEGGKIHPDKEAKYAMQLKNKAERELARGRKTEAARKGASAYDDAQFEDLSDDDAMKSKDTSQPTPVAPPEHSNIGAKPPKAPGAATPQMAGGGRQTSASRTHIKTAVSYRGKPGAPIAGLNKGMSRSEIVQFYLKRSTGRGDVTGLSPEEAGAKLDMANMEKADPKGGSYHRRVTDQKSGKHRYFYTPEDYAKHKDAHVDGQEALKGYIHKQIAKKMDEHGECDIEHFKDLALKHGADRVGDALREGCASKMYEFRKGKFRKCMKGY